MSPTPNATIVQTPMPSLACALGPVQIASLWSQPRAVSHFWKALKAATPHSWKTTTLPGANSGKF